ncbi:hypothetical protein J6590_039394 [Homalodisca vitripennis]|nr:hypothetical protein J6590_039394 [Homalodisca vitripennis]
MREEELRELEMDFVRSLCKNIVFGDCLYILSHYPVCLRLLSGNIQTSGVATLGGTRCGSWWCHPIEIKNQ